MASGSADDALFLDGGGYIKCLFSLEQFPMFMIFWCACGLLGYACVHALGVHAVC